MRKTRRLTNDELAPWCWEISRAGSVSDGPLNWTAFFGNDHPVEIEVGMGKGLFLLTAKH